VIAALLVLTASAADWLEPWGTGLHQRAPTTWSVGGSYHQVIGDTWTHTPELQAGIPIRRADLWGGGLTLRVNGSGLIVPDEGRSLWNIGALEGAGWIYASGPNHRHVHGAGLVVGGAAVNASTFWRLSRDTSVYFGAFYDGYYRPHDALHLAVRVDVLGTIGDDIATLTTSVIAVPHRMVAIHAGAQVGGTSLWVANAGVRVRPLDGLELGVTMTVPLLVNYDLPLSTASYLRPSLEVRGWFPNGPVWRGKP
jgi:hypothetical protein